MKKFAILLSLSLITGVLFSACSLLQVEETTPSSDEGNGTSVDLSVEVMPEGEDEAPSVAIPLAVNIQ